MNENPKQPPFPSREISETFLEFLEPLLEVMDNQEDKEEMEQILMIGFTVWNAVAFSDAAGKHTHMENLRKTRNKNPDTRPLIERLIEQKGKRMETLIA